MTTSEQRYADCLYTASQHEKHGRLQEAIAALKAARRYTHDHGELQHLALWQGRLENELEGEA